MFNLEYQLGKWRGEMAATGLAPEILDELEQHLRDDFEQQVRGGTDPEEAFAAALRRLGPPGELRAEFGRNGSPGMASALRRHRRKVWLGAGVCLLVGIGLNVFRPLSYVSEATLVVQSAAVPVAVSSSDAAAAGRVANSQRASQTEIAARLFRSIDLARSVAQSVGPEAILRRTGGGEDVNPAGAMLQRGMVAEGSPENGVIRLSLRHPDADIVQPALREWIQLHAEMHRRFTRLTNNPMTIVSQQAPSVARVDFLWGERLSGLAWLTGAGFLAGLVWMLVAGVADVFPGSLGAVRRHKWKFVLCAGAGLATAATIYALRPVVYQSETKLYVRYFIGEASIPGADATRREPPTAAVAIVERERARLTSMDILRQAAINVGPERILKKAGGGQDVDRAATAIQRGVAAIVVPRSSVIRLSFQHQDANIVRPVLSEMTRLYLLQHSAANRPEVGAIGDITKITNISVIQSPPPAWSDRAKAQRIFVQVVLAGIMAGFAWMLFAGLLDRRTKVAQ